MREDHWYTYMVRCGDGTIYTGIAKNIDKRLEAHNAGVGAKYTRSRRPVRLVYLEECSSRSAAARREYLLKKMPLPAKVKLVAEAGIEKDIDRGG